MGDRERKLDLRSLLLYTELPEWWSFFELVVSLSPPDANGFLTLSAAQTVLNDVDVECSDPKEFWSAMSYFLYRENDYIATKRKAKYGNSGKNTRR